MEMPDPRYKVCKKCPGKQIWKPERTHHCKVAKACIPKMDHYCPLTLTTVGYSNHQAFVLYCTYQSLTIFYAMLIIANWIYRDFLTLMAHLSMPGAIAMTALVTLDLFVMTGFFFFTFTMAFAHMDFIVNNITTLDNLSLLDPVRSRDLPVSDNNRFVWNLGLLYNLKVVGFLGIFWWFPKKFGEKYEGYHWNRFDKAREHIRSIGCAKFDKENFIKEAKEKYFSYTLVYSGGGYKVSDYFKNNFSI